MKDVIYVNLWGGLGDVVLSTPIFKELKSKYPNSRTVVNYFYQGQADILQGNPYVDILRPMTFFNKVYYKFLVYVKKIKIHNIAYGSLRPAFSYAIKASEIIAEMMDLKLTDTQLQLYLKKEEDLDAREKLSAYKNSIIIHITSVASTNQMWPVENWNQLVKNMPDYTFIQLGLISETMVEGAVDMRGKTSIRESIALIKNAHSFVGVVSFFSHVTNAFNKYGVVFFGPSSPSVWGHENNINVTKELPCSPCIDFLGKGECPYDKLCMRLISVEEVEDMIIKQLSYRNQE